MPPNNTKLERNYIGGTTVPFGTGSNYTCRDGTFFGSDFHKTHIAINCNTNGSWDAPGCNKKLFGLSSLNSDNSTISFQRNGTNATPCLKKPASILHLLPSMVEYSIGTQLTQEVALLITHLSPTLVEQAGNLSNTHLMIQ